MKVTMYSLEDQTASVNTVAKWFQQTWWYANKMGAQLDVEFVYCRGHVGGPFRDAIVRAAKSINANLTIREASRPPLYVRDAWSSLNKSLYSGVKFIRHVDGTCSSICSLTGCDHVNLSLL